MTLEKNNDMMSIRVEAAFFISRLSDASGAGEGSEKERTPKRAVPGTAALGVR